MFNEAGILKITGQERSTRILSWHPDRSMNAQTIHSGILEKVLCPVQSRFVLQRPLRGGFLKPRATRVVDDCLL